MGRTACNVVDTTEPIPRGHAAHRKRGWRTAKGKIVWKSRKQEAMNTIRRQKYPWSRSCRWEIPGKRLRLRQDFASVERPHIVWCKRYRRGEKLLFRTEDMGIRPNCEKLCFNGWLRLAAWLHRYQVERCKRHCKNGLPSMSVLVTLIESVPNWALGITSDA